MWQIGDILTSAAGSVFDTNSSSTLNTDSNAELGIGPFSAWDTNSSSELDTDSSAGKPQSKFYNMKMKILQYENENTRPTL